MEIIELVLHFDETEDQNTSAVKGRKKTPSLSIATFNADDDELSIASFIEYLPVY